MNAGAECTLPHQGLGRAQKVALQRPNFVTNPAFLPRSLFIMKNVNYRRLTMKSLKTIGVIAILGSSSVLADPAADSGLVSVFLGQTANLHVVNIASDDKTCRFKLSFINSAGITVGSTSLEIALEGGESGSWSVAPTATTLLRAHIDFEPQLIANLALGQTDLLNGCYRLIPTFEVSDASSTQVLNTRFYGMPSPEKGKKLEKVKICHKPGTPAEKTLEVPVSALKGHMGHGDSLGECDDD
jgi:hypothetical protein